MKKLLLASFILGWLTILSLQHPKIVKSAETYKLNITPVPCSSVVGLGDCPTGLAEIYKNEPCVNSYEAFIQNPVTNHFWVVDPEVTTQGKADDRARQFIYWALSRSAIDEHPVLKTIWGLSRNIAWFLVILVAAIMGIGITVGTRFNFDFKIKIWPLILRIVALLLYIAFSASIVLIMIQLSEILMKFFVEKLGGQDLFNIYFSGASTESNYVNFIGCRDLNFRVMESVETELFLLKITNYIYYLIGIMIILRKIILWFLLFISPFLAILAPFVLIRNVGWIWIGVFLQWLFYGPIFALFLGAVATIWKVGIPFPFDFSRVNSIAGYIYPTGTHIVYGGPAQIADKLWGPMNSLNYVDTFAEYIISLLMLLAATLFPWWLLRIFRDYCCDGILAMKNILLSMYDTMRGGPTPQPPISPLTPASISTALKLPKSFEIPVKVKLETLEEIKRTKTEDITRSLNISTQKLTDIANFETNKQVQQTVKQNLDYLSNPTHADTPTERQKFMNIRTELFNRAVRQDQAAQQVLASISSSKTEQLQRRVDLSKSIPVVAPVTHVISVKVKMPQEKVNSITNSLVRVITTNTQLMESLAQTVNLQVQQIQTILHLMSQNMNKPIDNIMDQIGTETGIEKQKVEKVIKTISQAMETNNKLLETVAQQENIETSTLKKFVDEQLSVVIEPGKTITESIVIPPTVPLEEYESVKKMWQKQYESGEVPVSENIKSRAAWVQNDTVFITNTLNKLLSTNQDLRLEGLDDLGYILPIILINNMKGDELLVYLKAKLEAAKTVAEQLTREQEITAKLKSESEKETVEVASPKKKEAEKEMEMTEELKIKN